jgi:AcrR family transcriptional regulator
LEPGRSRRTSPRKGDLREKAILDAAEALLEEEGLGPVTVEQIAKKAGISRAALYFYFGSKQDVVTALVARMMRTIRATVPTDQREVSPKVAIERVIRQIEKHWREHGVVMRIAVENAPHIAEVRDLWNGTILAYIDPLATVLARAGVTDDGPAGALELATALTWMSERNFYMASLSATPETQIRRTAETVIAIWWRAMGVDDEH